MVSCSLDLLCECLWFYKEMWRRGSLYLKSNMIYRKSISTSWVLVYKSVGFKIQAIQHNPTQVHRQHTHTSTQRLFHSFPLLLNLFLLLLPNYCSYEFYCWRTVSLFICFRLLQAALQIYTPRPPHPAAALLSFHSKQLLWWWERQLKGTGEKQHSCLLFCRHPVISQSSK